MDYKALFESPEAIMLYTAIILYGYRTLAIQHKWNTERWEGMVASAFLAAEKAGVLGEGKLKLALDDFYKQYTQTHGTTPSPLDMRDAALDFGKLALQMKFVPPAPAPTVTATATKAV